MKLREFTADHINVLLPLSLILVVCKSFPIVSSLYYLVAPIFLLFIISALKIFRNKYYLKIIFPALVFTVWCLITSFWSVYPQTTIMRSFYFFFIFLSAISGTYLWKNKYDNPAFFLPVNIVVLLVSLFSIVTNIPHDSWSGGNGLGFMGFASHQNMLAMFILFCLPTLLILLIEQKRLKWILSILIFVNISLMVLTYSRASILSMSIAAFVIAVFYFKKKALITLLLLASISLLIYFFIPGAGKYTDKIIVKDSAGIFANRIILWGPSCKAAMNGGVVGLGYGVSDPGIKTSWGIYKDEQFIREKGSSILGVIEETGLIGLALIIWLFYAFCRNIFNSGINRNNIVIAAFMVAFIIHAQFEAWVTGVAGFPLTFLFCLLSIDY